MCEREIDTPRFSEHIFERTLVSLPPITWSSTTKTLESISDRLPQVIKHDGQTHLQGSANPHTQSLSEPLLAHTVTDVTKVMAINLQVSRDTHGVLTKRVPITDVTIVVPENNPAWFSKLRDDREITSYTNIESLTSSKVTKFLIATPCKGHILINDRYPRVPIPPGTVLSISKTSPVRRKSSLGNLGAIGKFLQKHKQKHLQCTDEQGRDVLIKFDRKGKFYPVEVNGEVVPDECVMQMKTILLHMSFSDTCGDVTMIYGKIPTPMIFTNHLRLLMTSCESVVIAATMKNYKNVLLEIPRDTCPMMFHVAEQDDDLKESSAYRAAMTTCNTNIHGYLTEIKQLSEAVYKQRSRSLPAAARNSGLVKSASCDESRAVRAPSLSTDHRALSEQISAPDLQPLSEDIVFSNKPEACDGYFQMDSARSSSSASSTESDMASSSVFHNMSAPPPPPTCCGTSPVSPSSCDISGDPIYGDMASITLMSRDIASVDPTYCAMSAITHSSCDISSVHPLYTDTSSASHTSCDALGDQIYGDMASVTRSSCERSSVDSAYFDMSANTHTTSGIPPVFRTSGDMSAAPPPTCCGVSSDSSVGPTYCDMSSITPALSTPASTPPTSCDASDMPLMYGICAPPPPTPCSRSSSEFEDDDDDYLVPRNVDDDDIYFIPRDEEVVARESWKRDRSVYRSVTFRFSRPLPLRVSCDSGVAASERDSNVSARSNMSLVKYTLCPSDNLIDADHTPMPGDNIIDTNRTPMPDDGGYMTMNSYDDMPLGATFSGNVSSVSSKSSDSKSSDSSDTTVVSYVNAKQVDRNQIKDKSVDDLCEHLEQCQVDASVVVTFRNKKIDGMLLTRMSVNTIREICPDITNLDLDRLLLITTKGWLPKTETEVRNAELTHF